MTPIELAAKAAYEFYAEHRPQLHMSWDDISLDSQQLWIDLVKVVLKVHENAT